jgi:hypothetical protein
LNGSKVHIQKKLILLNLKELHQLFKTDHPTLKVSFSKFASLRPQHCILAGAAGTHSVCVCKYHQNVKLMIEGANFKSYNPTLATYQDFLSEVLCNPPTSSCYLDGCCKSCPGLENLQESLLDLMTENCVEEIKYKQWSAVDRSSLDTHTKKLSLFIETFCVQLKELLPHHFVAKQQGKFLQTLKEELPEGEVVTICDFSENYTFVIQDSVQGYYFANEQATIHPFVSYYKDGEELKVLSQVVVSDYMKHGKDAVYAFLKDHISLLKQKVPGLAKVHYFSDGASAQYKNCFNMMNVSHHFDDFDVNCEWHFFATSHGKGPSDERCEPSAPQGQKPKTHTLGC